MFLNVDQLEKQLDKEEFQEIGSTTTFRVLKMQFQKFINSRFSLDGEEGLMTRSSETEFEEQNTSSSLGIDADADDADFKPVYDEEPMIEVQLTDVFAIGQQHVKYSSKNMSRFSLNDMVHNHYLDEARKKTQESGRNLRPSVVPSARSQSTANGRIPKPKINNQKSWNWPASKTSCTTTKTVPIAEHSRNSRNFSDSKYFVCSTCQKCVFNANYDSCVTKFLNEVNSHAKVPTGNIFTSSTTKVDSDHHIVRMQISLTHINAYKLLMLVQTDISETRGSRNSNMMKVTMTSDDNTSGLAP
ncbi:hypothetical protein Tco_0927600 [Tanacetum coccineum]